MPFILCVSRGFLVCKILDKVLVARKMIPSLVSLNRLVTLLIRGLKDSSVGIATRYGLDDPGIESRWGRGFPHPSRPALGPTQPPI